MDMKDTNREPVPVAHASVLRTVSATGLRSARGSVDTLRNPVKATKNRWVRLGAYLAHTNRGHVDKRCVYRGKAAEMVLLATSSRRVSARKTPRSDSPATRLVLTLFGLLSLLLAGCSSQTPAERAAEAYWRTLQTGEVGEAYGYLSAAERTFISEAAFSSRVRYDLYPHLFFSQYDGVNVFYGSADEGEDEGQDAASAEVTEVVREGTYATATARLKVPAYETLGETFTDALGETQSQDRREQAVVRALRELRRAQLPLSETWHRFKLIREEGTWRVTYPRWRAEAMLAQAKALAAEGALAEAQTLLSELGRYAATLDAEARETVTRAASRGRRMLPHLPGVRLTNFTLGAGEGCPARASLTLRNGNYDLRTATVEVDFAGERTQTFVLGREAGPVAEGEAAYFELCLRPPPGWQGEASAKVVWLEFTEEVYKSRIE